MASTLTDIQRYVRLSRSMWRLGATPQAKIQAAFTAFRVFRELDKPVQLRLRKNDVLLSVWVRDRSHLVAIEEVLGNTVYAEAAVENPGLIIDLGANIGASVLYFKSCYPNAEVIALEPDPASFGLLQKNTEALSDVTVHQAAAGPTAGVVQFANDRDSISRSTVVLDTAMSTISVPSVHLDDLADGRPVDLLKIDIEGAEFEVLRSADLSEVRCVVGEIHLGNHTTRDADVLADLLPGFSVRFTAIKSADAPWEELREFVAEKL